MKQIGIILVTIFVLSSGVQAESSITLAYSSNSISNTKDLAVKSNSLRYLYSKEASSGDTTYKMASVSKTIKLKSPTAAFVIALLPGSVVHGAGHFYAGKPVTGVVLLGVEIIGAGLLYMGAMYGFAEAMGGEPKGNGDATGFIGLALFLGSWLYDIIESPAAVNNRNDKILGKEPFELGIKF